MPSTPCRAPGRRLRSRGLFEGELHRERARASSRRGFPRARDRAASENSSERRAQRWADQLPREAARQALDPRRTPLRSARRPRTTRLLQRVEEGDAVRDEEDADDDGQPREIALDDVCTAL